MLSKSQGRFAALSFVSRRFAGISLAALALVIGTSQGTQDAVANGDTRTISLHHVHTKETVSVTFRRNGQYDAKALEQLNWLLRDWRRDEATRMDPRLFDVLWTVHREVGSDEPIHVVSAYRSPQTNAMLRRRSRAVAEQSQHMVGKAVDFYLPDVAMERVRAVGMRLQAGGVGYYPTSYSPFVHLDVGSVRAWPRMSRDQLARIFPDGKTVHLPADGRPLAGYDEARAEILARGGSVAGITAVAANEEPAPGPRRRSFWASLFGADEDEDLEEIRASRGSQGGRVAFASAAPGGDESPSSALLAYNAGMAAQRRMAAAPPMPAPPLMAPPAPAVEPAPALLDARPRPAEPLPSPGPMRVAALQADSREVFRAAMPPLPPRRPDDVTTTGALAFAPQALRPDLPKDGGKAPPPAAKPGALSALMGGPHPLPPPRPPERVQVAAIGPVAIPAPRGGLAAAPAPTPDARAQLHSLLGKAEIAPKGEPVQPRTANVRVQVDKAVPAGVLTASATVTTAFSKTPATDLSTTRFSGPAVKAPGPR